MFLSKVIGKTVERFLLKWVPVNICRTTLWANSWMEGSRQRRAQDRTSCCPGVLSCPVRQDRAEFWFLPCPAARQDNIADRTGQNRTEKLVLLSCSLLNQLSGRSAIWWISRIKFANCNPYDYESTKLMIEYWSIMFFLLLYLYTFELMHFDRSQY